MLMQIPAETLAMLIIVIRTDSYFGIAGNNVYNILRTEQVFLTVSLLCKCLSATPDIFFKKS